MSRDKREPIFDETAQDAEVSILKGLQYLEHEAYLARLETLAETIGRALADYEVITGKGVKHDGQSKSR